MASSYPETDLHCGECKTNVAKLVEPVYYPGCRHVFCESCFKRHYNHTNRTFLCPLDYTTVDWQAPESQEFYARLSAWHLLYQRFSLQHDTQTESELRTAFQRLTGMMNFVLFPCIFEAGHTGFDTCQYDHSAVTVEKAKAMKWFCLSCKVNTKKDLCPRCGEACRRREVTVSNSRETRAV